MVRIDETGRSASGGGGDPAAGLPGGGPAIYFASVKGCRFPMLSNLYGTMERMRYIFRDSLDAVSGWSRLAVDPADVFRRPRLHWKTPWTAWLARPRKVRTGPVLTHQTTLDQLPQLKCWPDEGGAFITLPLVYTEDPDRPRAWRTRTWGCTACRFPAASIARARRRDSITRSAPRDRRAPRGGDPPQRAAAGERLRRRSAGHDRRRRDAAAGRDERAGLRRHPRPAAAADDRRGRAGVGAAAHPRRGRFLPSSATSSPTSGCPRAPSATIWATTA